MTSIGARLDGKEPAPGARRQGVKKNPQRGVCGFGGSIYACVEEEGEPHRTMGSVSHDTVLMYLMVC